MTSAVFRGFLTRSVLVVGLAFSAVVCAEAAPAAAAPPEPGAGAYRTAGTISSWYELRLPQSTPRGIVLLFHGGGWRNVGPAQVQQLADYRGGELVREWRTRGFITVLSTYGSGEASWNDVVAVYDQLHARYPDLPIGAYGQSAGGQLALLLGGARQLAFVVSDAGPTDWATWKSAYPCYYRNCATILTVGSTPFTGVGQYWIDVQVAETFGGPIDPAPNLDDYNPAPNYSPTRGPDPFLIYGRRYRQLDPAKTQIEDGTPADGANGNAYVDGDNDPATSADQLETDTIIPQQQGVLLKNKVGSRAVLRTLPRGTMPWIHAYVDDQIAAPVYREMLDWTVVEAETAASPPDPKTNPGVPPGTGQPAGRYLARTCNAAPRGSGVFSTGAWQPEINAPVGLDAAEVGCSSAASGQARGEGMELRTRPAAVTTVAADAATAMTFSAPTGTTVYSYEASYRGLRATQDWTMSLTARSESGIETTLASCTAGAPCGSAPDSLVPPGTTDPAVGPFPTQTFQLPDGMTSLSWRLSCRNPADCATQDVSFLNVYTSHVTLLDHEDPAIPDLIGDFADGVAHGGVLRGSVQSADAGSGVQRVDVRFGGTTQTSEARCDFSLPRPCPARHNSEIVGDTSSLPDGLQPVTVTVLDGSGRSRTRTAQVIVNNAEPPPLLLAATSGPAQPALTGLPGQELSSTPGKGAPSRPDPFETGTGAQQLASCTGAPHVLSSRLRGQRITVLAIASRRDAGRLATLRSGGRTVAAARISTDGRVRLAGRLRRSEREGSVRVRAGGRASAGIPVRAAIDIRARRNGARITLTGSVARSVGRRVEIQQLVSCDRWRTVATVRTTGKRGFERSLLVDEAVGGAYRAVATLRAPLSQVFGRQSTSTIAVA